MKLKRLVAGGIAFLMGIASMEAMNIAPGDVSASVSLKVPGNAAKQYPLALQRQQGGVYSCRASEELPLTITRTVADADGRQRVTVVIKAVEDVYFNYGEQVKTGYRHADSRFYMPGFWYRRNLRSPKEAPSFHTSDSWLVREDRLSTPLTAAFNPADRKSMSVIRIDKFDKEAFKGDKSLCA